MKIPVVYTAVFAMLFQQALSTMSGLTIPVLAPPIAAETGMSASLVGVYTAFLYGGSMISSLAGGGFLLRYGALRVSQTCLLVVAIGLLINMPGYIYLFVLGAIVTGLGGGPSTPASSQILARYTKPSTAPFIFSIKQTGVPVGGVIAGALLPVFVDLFGWRGALACAASMALVFALILQPFRAEFDSDRQPERSLKLTDLRATLGAVLRDARVRELALGLFAFTGLQLAFASFFVSFLSLGMGWTLTDAGIAYSIAMGAGIAGRLIWGWVGSRYVSPVLLLAVLGLAMGVACMAIGLVDESWEQPAVWVVAFCYGITGIGYQGVLLAEIARVAPPGMAGVVTGGAVFFAYAGMITFPGSFGLILALTDSYQTAFVILGAIPIIVGAMLFISARRQRVHQT
ncbi:MAG: MFS family permease [Paracoccaceae bacterium]|jgi:MFS family permease